MSASGTGWTIVSLVVMISAVMAINLVTLLSADKIFSRISPTVLKVLMRILGLLLCGLAVQLVIIGLVHLGVLPHGAGGH